MVPGVVPEGVPVELHRRNAKSPFFGVPPVPAFQRSAPILEKPLWNHPGNPLWNAYCEPALSGLPSLNSRLGFWFFRLDCLSLLKSFLSPRLRRLFSTIPKLRNLYPKIP
jgi:hypothetical protein